MSGDVKFEGTQEEWDALVKKNNADALAKQETFIKAVDGDCEWLSPVATERAWQEEKLVEIFEHYPNASPKWQYMNGLIQNSLDAREMYSEHEVLEIIRRYALEEHLITSSKPDAWFEQFKNKSI